MRANVHSSPPRLAAWIVVALCGVTAVADGPQPLWDTTLGQPTNDKIILAVLPHKDGIIIGGQFTMAGGSVVNRIARWNEAVMNWEPMGAGFNGSVRALAEYNGWIIAAGSFISSGGVPLNRIARWDATGGEWLPLGDGLAGCYDEKVCGPVVSALLAHNGELIAGGTFTVAGLVPAVGLAKWVGEPDGSGTWERLGDLNIYECASWHCEPDVYSLHVHDGALYAAGFFDTIDSATVNHVGRLDAASGTWQPLGSGVQIGGGFDPKVFALTSYEGDLIAAGAFHFAGGSSARRAARWDGEQWHPMGQVGTPLDEDWFSDNFQPHALAVLDGRLYIGGDFQTIDDEPAQHAAVWTGPIDSGKWQPLAEPPNMGMIPPWGSVRAIEPHGNSLIFAGSFTSVGPHPASRIAQLVHPPRIVGDLNGDGSVGVADLLILLSMWGPCDDCAPDACPADLDGDCAVGVSDLLILLSNWTSS